MDEQDKDRENRDIRNINEINRMINRMKERKKLEKEDGVDVGTYRVEKERWRWQTALFESKEEAEGTLGFHSNGEEEYIVTKVTLKRGSFNQCDYCGGIVSGYIYCSDMIRRGVYCSVSCIAKSLQESIPELRRRGVKNE